ncbi:hypothetical protein N665_0260s0018 [Sinapis alba]|nr:hypothetical protein N665_0260s0018 [Sinapis alba]
MGQQQSKWELLFQQVSYGNAEGIRALRREGADLEWRDKEGNTPLSLACKQSMLFNVAQTLIELGANVNAPRNATPLYHAARRGLENTVNLLLSNGDTIKFPSVLRAIESHICVFSGWMREFYGHALLDVFAPQLRSRSVWVVIIPTSSIYPKPYKFELVVYASLQDAEPLVVMALRNPNLQEPENVHPNTSVMIVDNDNNEKRSLKLAPSLEEGRQQLKWFCDACKGIPQVVSEKKKKTRTLGIKRFLVSYLPSLFYILKLSWNQNIQPVRSVLQTVQPSAPPLTDDDIGAVEEGPIHYPLYDSSSSEVPSASVGGANTENGRSGQCVICMDAPSVAACVPCGHIAGCMSCLNEIKSKGLGCPICRASIDQIMLVYHV